MGIKVALEHRTSYTSAQRPAPHHHRLVDTVTGTSRRGRRFETTGFTPGRVDMAVLREKQARHSTDVGVPGILDLRRVRTVLH